MSEMALIPGKRYVVESSDCCLSVRVVGVLRSYEEEFGEVTAQFDFGEVCGLRLEFEVVGCSNCRHHGTKLDALPCKMCFHGHPHKTEDKWELGDESADE